MPYILTYKIGWVFPFEDCENSDRRGSKAYSHLSKSPEGIMIANKPAIVVVGYNRPKALERLLRSSTMRTIQIIPISHWLSASTRVRPRSEISLLHSLEVWAETADHPRGPIGPSKPYPLVWRSVATYRTVISLRTTWWFLRPL